MKITEIKRGDGRYPKRLLDLADPPKRLFCAGNMELLHRPALCMAGSRKTTGYGRTVAERIATRMASHGVTIVSGLARGIDTCAHQGALKAGGDTIAVLGCGIDVPYPWANRDLKEEIMKKGLVISEYEEGMPATRYTFPRRNRIMAALGNWGVIVEAGLGSGALITAEILEELGRPLYAVPANINNPNSMGSNRLIRDGAMPLVVVDDLLSDLGMERENEEVVPDLGTTERQVYEVISRGGEQTVDEIAEALGMGTGPVTGVVTVLEMKGLLCTELGKVFLAN